jgi:hypothetical protein
MKVIATINKVSYLQVGILYQTIPTLALNFKLPVVLSVSVASLLLYSKNKREIMKLALYLRVFVLCALVSSASTISASGDLSNPDAQKIQLTEPERLQEYARRNYTWPLNNYSPNTSGWKSLMEERFAQVAEMDENRYEGYIQTIHSAFLGKTLILSLLHFWTFQFVSGVLLLFFCF